jgi:hypothetical protein
MNGRSTNGRTTSTGNFNCELIYAAGDTIGIPARAEDREVAQPGVDPIGSKSWAAKRLQGCAVNLADTAATLALKMVVLAGANSNRQLKVGGTVMWRGKIFGNMADFEKRMPHQLSISKRFSLATVLSMDPLHLLRDLCTRSIIMDTGRITIDAPTTEIVHDEELLEQYGLELP